MALKISQSSLLARHILTVRKNGIKFYGASLWGTRRFRFEEIDCVLLSTDHQLSFQVGREVFTIATKTSSKKHQAAIAALLAGVEGTRVPAGTSTTGSSNPWV